MNNCITLPVGYIQTEKIDLQEDKKLAILVNAIALLIGIIMLIPAVMFIPISFHFDLNGMKLFFIRFGAIMIGMILYLVLHELVHGIFMKAYSNIKVNYGFTGLYAYAGSKAYFNKKCYIIIALAPVMIWGIVLILTNLIVPISWFWVVYFIQIFNISGAAGDFFVAYKICKFPSDVLINDIGVSMTIYSRA